MRLMSSEKMCIHVLFDGTKFFWNTRSCLKIIIVNHPQQICIEIIAYNPTDGKEFPRMYLDSSMVMSKLDKDNMEKILMSENTILDEIKTRMMMEYVYSRITLTSLAVEGNERQMVLQPTFDDVMVEGDGNSLMKIDVERLKPDDLAPYKVTESVPFS